MPTAKPIANRYYPKLSEVITMDHLPEFLAFAKQGLAAVFDKIHYKNLQYSKSYRGDSAHTVRRVKHSASTRLANEIRVPRLCLIKKH